MITEDEPTARDFALLAVWGGVFILVVIGLAWLSS
jgi:hypothetical protein